MNRILASAILFLGVTGFSQEDNALHFDGVDDYVDMNSISGSMESLSEFTIEFWLKYDHGDNTNYETFYSANASDGGNVFLIRNSELSFDGLDSVAVVYINEGGTNQYMVGETVIGNTRCHHIAFTYNAGACSLYVDGELDIAASHIFSFSSGDLHSLGQEYDLGPVTSAFYNGVIEDFRVWDVERTQSEISDNMELELTGSEPNLICNITFNQGTSEGDNTGITEVTNSSVTDGSENGSLVDFNLDGTSSNFIEDDCSHLPTTNNTVEIENDFVTISSLIQTDEILLKFLEPVDKVSVSVVDASGRSVFNTSFAPTSSHILDVANLKPGMYFIQVADDHGHANSSKFVKL